MIQNSTETLLPHLDATLHFDWANHSSQTQSILDQIDYIRSNSHNDSTAHHAHEFIEGWDWHAHQNTNRIKILKQAVQDIEGLIKESKHLDWDVAREVQSSSLYNTTVLNSKKKNRFKNWKLIQKLEIKTTNRFSNI